MRSLVLLLFFSILLTAQEKDTTTFVPNHMTTYTAKAITEKVIIDAKLDESFWQEAQVATDFSEIDPGDNVRPVVNTKAYLAFDRENIYVAMICYDDPTTIRANWRDRDQIWNDDFAGVFFDTYGTASWGYFISANPNGIQGDNRISSTSGEDVNFDMVFESEGRITEDGYIIEMAIPFSSLRFPNKDIQNWRINFWRNRPHETRAQYSWTSISRDDPCWLCQLGYLEGIQGAQSGKTLKLIPSIVGGQGGSVDDTDEPDSEYISEDPDAEFGVTLKWTATPSLTVEGTFNPDFSQVESDVAQIDVNQTFALFFPERRPFFQEGSDLFKTWIQAVYTRSINDPIAAGKVIGRWEKATLAVLSAIDENTPVVLPFEEKSEFVALKRSLSNIIRAQYNFDDGSYVGVLATDRRYEEGGSGSTFGFDGKYRFWTNNQVELQVLGSFTEEPDDTSLTEDFNGETFANGKYTADFDGESYAGNGIYLGLGHESRHWNMEFNFRQASPTFRAANGFISGNDIRKYTIEGAYTFYFENSWIQRIRPFLNTGLVYNFDGLEKDNWYALGTNFTFAAQTFVHISYLINRENFKRMQFKDLNRLQLIFNTDFSDPVQFGFFMRYGNFIGDRGEDVPVRSRGIENLELWATLKPTNRFILTPVITYAEAFNAETNEKLYQGYLGRLRMDYQFTRELALRLILQYDQFSDAFSMEPLLSYKINPFSVFYLGATSGYNYYGSQAPNQDLNGWRNTSGQVFLKFQYLFEI